MPPHQESTPSSIHTPQKQQQAAATSLSSPSPAHSHLSSISGGRHSHSKVAAHKRSLNFASSRQNLDHPTLSSLNLDLDEQGKNSQVSSLPEGCQRFHGLIVGDPNSEEAEESKTPPTTATPVSIFEELPLEQSQRSPVSKTKKKMASYDQSHPTTGAGAHQPSNIDLSSPNPQPQPQQQQQQATQLSDVRQQTPPPKMTHSPDSVDHHAAASQGQSEPPSGNRGMVGGVLHVQRRPGGLNDNPNARSKSITMADSENTCGALNRHPAGTPSHPYSYRVGVSEDRNKKCRRTMEDAHSFVYDFAGVKGQGYFAVFDGHAGKQAAEWCGQNFHEYLLDALIESPESPIPDLLNETFHVVDSRLSKLASQENTHSGCTAVTAFLRLEERERGESTGDPAAVSSATPPKGFVNPQLRSRGLMEGKGEEELEKLTARRSAAGGSASIEQDDNGSGGSTMQRKSSGRRIKDFVGRLTGSASGSKENSPPPSSSTTDAETTTTTTTTAASTTSSAESSVSSSMQIADGTNQLDLIEATSDKGLRRVLYTANVGDARAVLCRGGKAVRLTYDHKGSDVQEAKRITDAGGFVMNNRVNGVLAVTRSLGDSSMKEFVVGAPYTTETTLDDDDEFLIVACDGLWDVCEDQDAVNLIRNVADPQEASKILLDHAMQNYSTDNLSVMVVRFKDLE